MNSPVDNSVALSLQQLSLSTPAISDGVTALIGARSSSVFNSFTSCKVALTFSVGICKILKEGLTFFRSGALANFDALVSDTACHIRAAVIASLYKRLSSDISFQKETKHCIDTCVQACVLFQKQACQASSEMPIIKASLFDRSVGELLSDSLGAVVTAECVLIAQAYLLTKIRRVVDQEVLCGCCSKNQPGYKDVTDSGKLAGYFGKTPSDWVSELVVCSKQNVASMALQMLRRLSCTVLDEFNRFDRSIKMIDGRSVLACSVGMDAVIRSSLSQNIAVLLKVKKEAHLVERSPKDPFDVAILYRPDGSGRLVPDVSGSAVEPVIVVEALRSGPQVAQEPVDQYISRLLQFDFIELLRLNAAQHPQYTKAEMVDDPVEQDMLTGLAQKAKAIGCSLDNQSLFCITHIFAETIGGRR